MLTVTRRCIFWVFFQTLTLDHLYVQCNITAKLFMYGDVYAITQNHRSRKTTKNKVNISFHGMTLIVSLLIMDVLYAQSFLVVFF